MHVMVEITENTIVLFQVSSIINYLFQALGLNFAEKTNGIVPCIFPQVWIKLSIQSECFWVPTPPQIIGQFIKATNAARHGREDRHAAKNFHRTWFLFFNCRASESSHDVARALQQRYDH